MKTFPSQIIHRKSMSKNRCFLCGDELKSSNRTVEHVFPRWVQKRCSLSEKTITIMNQTKIKYKQITVPCCKSCNNYYLNRNLEMSVKNAFDVGVLGVRDLDERVLFLWLNKICYSLLYKETNLKKTRRSNVNGNAIYTKKKLNDRYIQYVFLLAIRFETEFHNNGWSIFTFELEETEHSNFDFAYDHEWHCMYLIIGKVIVLAHLQDNGFFREHEEFIRYSRIKDMKLTINHVYELYSRLVTYSMIMKKDPFYTVVVEGRKFDKMSVICHELNGYVFHDDIDEISIYKKISFTVKGWIM